jgi:hypothetical protein
MKLLHALNSSCLTIILYNTCSLAIKTLFHRNTHVGETRTGVRSAGGCEVPYKKKIYIKDIHNPKTPGRASLTNNGIMMKFCYGFY